MKGHSSLFTLTHHHSKFHLSRRMIIPETIQVGGAAILVGLLGGAGVWLFKQVINVTHTIMFTYLGQWLRAFGSWTIIIVPVLGGLIVGAISYFWIGREKYHGLPGIIEACALAGGRLPYLKMPIRVLAAALSIGAGASVGPEDPSVQIGANLGSMFGMWLHLSEDRVRALVAGGAAAGIAAAFNAPIAGVFFALEVLLGELSSSSFAFAAISSVISAAFTQAVSGPQPAFAVPTYSIHSALELPLYILLGVLSGPLAAAYILLIHRSRKFFHEVDVPVWVKPAIAGAMVGLVGIFLPQVFGVGYETIGLILTNTTLPLLFLVALLIAKLVLTPTSIGGGFVGGVFAPSLFLGAMLGGAFGTVANWLFPGLGIFIPAYAMVGMAAVLAGTVHAPLTAILLMFEMTRDYRSILPLMFAVAISLLISRKLQKDSVYQLPLVENGIRLEHGRDVEVLEGITVSEVMDSHPIALHENEPLVEAIDRFSETRRHGLPVLDQDGRAVGMLTLQDLERAKDPETGKMTKTTVGAVCSRSLIVAFPDETLSEGLRRMSAQDIGRLPVVDRQDPTRLLGLLHRSDIIRAYDVALARRAATRHRYQEERLQILSGAEVYEVIVQQGSVCANHCIAEVSWPRTCVISSIRRRRQLLLPHGDTPLKPGDVLVIVSEGNGLETVRQLCKTRVAG